jgi:CHASE2 domain-containing sensor protein
MKNKYIVGLTIGICAGIIDLIPMIIQKLSWDANLSAFSMWVVIGFFLSISTLKIKGILKGLVISILILFPNLFIIGWKEPVSLIPILIMTMILGAISGYLYQKIIKE